ncbi:MAG: DUF4846 domain-containing protein [Planctomycetes bacterium]|nr:DUF4846 domain-containing protein [Planctomycetota bacterium]
MASDHDRRRDPTRAFAPRALAAPLRLRSRLALLLALLFPVALLRADPPAAPIPPRPPYPWLAHPDADAGSAPAPDPAHTLAARVAPPPGFTRTQAAPDAFAHWLRGLPLLPGRPPVLLHDGTVKPNQEAHHAVLDLDVGPRNLQQCADAVIRLRAEYLFARGATAALHFDFTSGDRCDWTRWAAGVRPAIAGNRVTWRAAAAPADDSYRSFRAWLDTVFTYAGTASLAREVQPLPIGSRIAPGDLFIRGGHPGHAVLVMDVAERAADGARVFLLAQSYMPAQQVHLLRNPGDPALSPWYSADLGARLVTPEWTFLPGDLRRFPEGER